MIKLNNLLSFCIGKKIYFSKLNNFLIVDYINKNIGKKIFFKKIFFFFNKKIILDKKGLNLKACFIILKHFYIKSISIKKKRRKNFLKTNINYKKKSLLFLQNII
ncbi:hypothetical protein CUN91_00220 [Candidatus Carsonella ruddii]|uniref:50S ribosomal protein L21 n=1 Tax=Carsonella ruddii TaxID=114186 RepID=A0A2K8K8M5_CARRU|nr:bL21 family ribosomal protein [Candidatus Carsonella ruddii]ATX33381.1 hypothetical protein CUN91_00220 [Candidatus Carsonella ruddii]